MNRNFATHLLLSISVLILSVSPNDFPNLDQQLTLLRPDLQIQSGNIGAAPKCFYCGSQEGKTKDLQNLSYVGLRINITDECQDICDQEVETAPILKQKDCYRNNYHGVYYAYDDRVQTCFSFDPRDEKRQQLYSYLPDSEKSENSPRELAVSKSCSSLADCFTCEGATASLCAWTNNACGQNLKAKAQQWYEAYLGCADTLGLCKSQKINETFYEYSQDFAPASPGVEQWIPPNYFCHYKIDLPKDVEWQIIVYRYFSILFMEEIEVVVDSGMMRYYNDDYLRERSYMYGGQQKKNFTSHYILNLKSNAKSVDVYTRNILKVNQPTYIIRLQEQEESGSFMGNVYSILSGLFTLTLCCLCIVGCMRCTCLNGGRVNYDVDEADPNWDSDQIRVYQIRRLQRQLTLNRQLDIAEQEEIQRKIKEEEQKNANMFINSIETIKMDSKAQQFDITDCVICLDPLEDGSMVNRIPTCKHIFHTHCCKTWFESKAQEDEQRCPQCNQVLKTKELFEAKQLNEGLVGQASRNSYPAGGRVANLSESQVQMEGRLSDDPAFFYGGGNQSQVNGQQQNYR